MLQVILLIVFLLVLIRAINVPETYDEAYSVLIADGKADPNIANNHWINTFFLKSVHFFGFQGHPFPERVLSVLSFLLYSFSVTKVLWRVKYLLPKILGFLVAIFNPFALEFFSLARGYASALAFIATSVMFMVLLVTETNDRYFRVWVFSAATSLLLAFYSSFGTLFLVVSLMGTHILFQLFLLRKTRQKSKFFFSALIYSSSLIFYIPGLRAVTGLNNQELLYFGGEDNFFVDSFGSLMVESFWPLLQLPSSFVYFLLVLSVIIFLAVLIFKSLSKVTTFLFTVIFFTFLMHEIAFYFLDVKFPISRTVLPIVPVLAMLIGYLLNDFAIGLLKLRYWKLLNFLKFFEISLAFLFVLNFLFWVNIKSTLSWPVDQYSSEISIVIEKLQQNGKDVVWCTNNYSQETVNYYLYSDLKQVDCETSEPNNLSKLFLTEKVDQPASTILLELNEVGLYLVLIE
jgi:hypothetical protein